MSVHNVYYRGEEEKNMRISTLSWRYAYWFDVLLPMI